MPENKLRQDFAGKFTQLPSSMRLPADATAVCGGVARRCWLSIPHNGHYYLFFARILLAGPLVTLK